MSVYIRGFNELIDSDTMQAVNQYAAPGIRNLYASDSD